MMSYSSELHFVDPYSQHQSGQGMYARIQHLYWVLRQQYAGLDRFSLALYQPQDDSLRTFACVGDQPSPLTAYQACMADVPSLQTLASSHQVRVVNDMRQFRSEEPSLHTARLLGEGYRASFAMPLRDDGQLLGFLFLNSHQRDYFNDTMVVYCSMWGHLVEQVVARERSVLRRLRALVDWALDVTNLRSLESEEHMRRMGQMSRLIARQLQPSLGLSDAWVEYLEMFAPLHDLGKIAIADEILAKPGPLSELEFETMKRHVVSGKALVEKAIRRFDLSRVEYIGMLGNIVHYHHERLDGSGYIGLQGKQNIPLEARIVAVADIADALFSERCYKRAWPLEQVVSELQRQAGVTLDDDCVAALINSLEEVAAIQAQAA